MKNRFLLLGGLLNLFTLLIGLTMGFFVGSSYSGRVNAQTTTAQVPVEEITSGSTIGTLGTALLLARHIQSDSLVVNGYDLLKFHQNTLDYLSKQTGANQSALQEIINKSKAEKLYTLRIPRPLHQEEKKP